MAAETLVDYLVIRMARARRALSSDRSMRTGHGWSVSKTSLV
jgi:hypothetical protein